MRRCTMSSTIRILAALAGSVSLLQACSNVAGVDDSSSGGEGAVAEYATAPLIERFHEDLTFTTPASCNGFQVIRHVTANVVMQTFFDREGNPVRLAIHVVEKNILTNSV